MDRLFRSSLNALETIENFKRRKIRLIDLNRTVIIDFWDGTIAFDEVQPWLRRLP